MRGGAQGNVNHFLRNDHRSVIKTKIPPSSTLSNSQPIKVKATSNSRTAEINPARLLYNLIFILYTSTANMGCGHSTTAQLQKQPVFKSDEAARHVYRIPALLYKEESKTLFAFAEQRKTSKDESAEKLVMRTGKVKEGSSEKTMVEWSKLKQLEKALIDGYRPMNPCPVYDKVNNKRFLFFICVKDGITEHDQIENYDNRTHLCYITSEDLGETWSDVIDLTNELSEIQNWATFAVGPGHGIQTESGRLIIPVYAYTGIKPNSKPYALSLYSDSHGENWKFGELFNTVSVECEMAELSEDHIYCNARNVGGYQVEAVSDDNEVKFNNLQPGNKLVETGSGCQGSVISFPAQQESANTKSEPSHNLEKWLLFTHPTSLTDRVELGVYLNKSPRDPKAWSEPYIINKGPSGYSDLAYIGAGWFACLFECGQQEIHEQIASVVFSYKDITKK
ncbi:LOW QUALITY PROTEIN: sialidase-2-like [Simochromis diagramma]|uniref:LOW QUALITY PROTEIN: sialidase-2-like n=1 Tax=Simochromis diagramma TaxID=43689 RepID=UPI001A7EDEF7|nr:LOW QUALITY PROTEIN: sialidase-2-like [Simochromis diagramma]